MDANPAALQTETLFHTYSQFSTVSNIPPKPTKEERETEARLEELFEKVRKTPHSVTIRKKEGRERERERKSTRGKALE